MSKLINKSCRHQDGWHYLPYPISSSVPSGCLYSVSQQAVNIVSQQRSTSEGTAFKQQSQLFDTSSSHLSAQPSCDLKVHLPIKHGYKTLIRPLYIFFYPVFMGAPHTITHDHTISVWFYDSDASCQYVFVCSQAREGKGKRGKGERGRGMGCLDTWGWGVMLCHRCGWTKKIKSSLKKKQKLKQCCLDGEQSRRTHSNTQTCPPHTTTTIRRRLSVAFLSLPLAVSQIPDDVLTGGLSDWRWGCVMTDQGLYQWPAHRQLAVWRLTGRLKPKTAAVPAWLPASLHFFSFFSPPPTHPLLSPPFPLSLSLSLHFNPSLTGCRSSLGLM